MQFDAFEKAAEDRPTNLTVDDGPHVVFGTMVAVPSGPTGCNAAAWKEGGGLGLVILLSLLTSAAKRGRAKGYWRKR